jgi:hypothetical protein
MKDDWRIVIEVEEAEAHGLFDRLKGTLSPDASELAAELQQRRLAVSQDGDEIFVYAGTRLEAQTAKDLIESVAAEHEINATVGPVEHWLADEERWDHEPNGTADEELLDEGFAPWEVRIPCSSHHEANELADKLEQEGYGVTRRWSYVIAGTATEEEAKALAERLHGTVEGGGEIVWETAPGNPWAVFGGLGGAGTPF